MAYATLEQARRYQGFEGVDDDALLSDLLDEASAYINSITGTSFEASTDSRSFDSVDDVDGRTLWFDQYAFSIASVTNGDGTTVASSDYVTEPRNDAPYYAVTLRSGAGVIWELDTDGFSENAVSVDGVWGYSNSDNTPLVIRNATLKLASWLYKQRESDSALDAPIVTASGMTIMPTGFPSDVMRALKGGEPNKPSFTFAKLIGA